MLIGLVAPILVAMMLIGLARKLIGGWAAAPLFPPRAYHRYHYDCTIDPAAGTTTVPYALFEPSD